MSLLRSLRPWLAVTLVIATVGLISHAADPEPDAALVRTRKQVKMLDDLYKSAIVLITENYVEEDSDLAAGDAFQALFKAMNDKGYHDVRLLDATGDPYDPENAPRKGFEQAAVKAINGGAATHEEVVDVNGVRSLRMATAVPVVLEKCILCHAHYADVKPGAAIGVISYTIAIE